MFYLGYFHVILQTNQNKIKWKMKYFIYLHIRQPLTDIRKMWICESVVKLLKYSLQVTILGQMGSADSKRLGVPAIVNRSFSTVVSVFPEWV